MTGREVRRGWLPDGIVSFWLGHLDSEPWAEDLAVYRNGELLVGIISHEGFAVLHVTEAERQSVAGQGIMLEPA